MLPSQCAGSFADGLFPARGSEHSTVQHFQQANGQILRRNELAGDPKPGDKIVEHSEAPSV